MPLIPNFDIRTIMTSAARGAAGYGNLSGSPAFISDFIQNHVDLTLVL